MKLPTLLASTLFAALLFAGGKPDTPRNVILFIGDGMSVPQRMVAEEFSIKTGNGKLAMNALPCHSTTRTCSASSLVTDSAAAATAIACGEKTRNGMLGVDKDGNRLESCAEAAKQAGLKVGIVTSVTINHATPAGFYAHRKHRSMLYEIGLDLIASRFDMFLGGGLAGANGRTDSPEYRGNLYALAAEEGWTVAEGREAFDSLCAEGPVPGRRIWWRSGERELPYAIDKAGDDKPRLPELTKLALDFLQDGFFLMVEGGRIDYAGHANEAATNLRDLLELDDAVKMALEFQKSHPDTLVIVTGDHETGGMSMGFAGTGYAFYMERLASQTCSSAAFEKRYEALRKEKGSACTFEDAIPLVEQSYGLLFANDGSGNPMVLKEDEIESLKKHFKGDGFGDKLRRIMQERAGVGWTSSAHTGLPVLTTASGPCAGLFTGLNDNTDISKKIKSFYGR